MALTVPALRYARASFARAFFLVLVGTIPGLSHAQKVEREFGISRAEVPAAAIAWLDSAFASERRRRERYYLDAGEADTTVEAKFRWREDWYSVEFGPEGHWLDTEVEVEPGAVPALVWQEVCADWAGRFSRFRIARVQHHRGREGEVFYEVELRTRRDFEWDRYEVRIAPDGSVLQEQLIELAPGHLDRW